MKIIICLAVLIAAAVLPQGMAQTGKDAVITAYDSDNIGTDGYSYGFMEDGISREESGRLKNVGTDEEALEVRGSFSYIGKDGEMIQVTYIADENGFRPNGDHIPTK